MDPNENISTESSPSMADNNMPTSAESSPVMGDNNMPMTTESSPSLTMENPMMGDNNIPASTESSPTLENTEASPVMNMTNEPTPPASKMRSTKQKEADAGQAEVLKRMRDLYNTEFADVPANKRPKAKAWAARAAYYKPTEEEREAYIQSVIRNDRNSLTDKESGTMNVVSANNNSDSLVNQLMAALDTATRVARQIKNTTRKNNKKSPFSNKSVSKNMNNSANASMNSNLPVNPYEAMNSNANVNENLSMNSYENNNTSPTSFTRSKRVSTLPKRRKTRKAIEPMNF